MNVIKFLNSSIGMKVIMALTGVIMVGFLIGHLSGNLLMFGGQESINAYAEWLHSLGPLLWAARIGLIAAIFGHVFAAIRLTRINRAARPNNYVHEQTVPIDFASKHTLETGLVILLFVGIHLLHFTFKALGGGYEEMKDSAGREDVYSMVVAGFSDPVFSTIYIVAMIAIGIHLSHAVHSALQTIGISDDDTRPKCKAASYLLGWALALGFISIPAGVLAGVIY